MARATCRLLLLSIVACCGQDTGSAHARRLDDALAGAGAGTEPLPGLQAVDIAGAAAEKGATSADSEKSSVGTSAAPSAGSHASLGGAAESTATAESLAADSSAALPAVLRANSREDSQATGGALDAGGEEPRKKPRPGFQHAMKVVTVTRKLSAGDGWQPTAFLYLRGPSEWQHRVFVGLRSGAVASMTLGDGSVEWSNVPSNPQGAVQTLYQKFGILVTATDSGAVQGWEVATGILKWETSCPSHVFQSVLDIGGTHDGFGLVCKQQIEYRTLSGDRLWTTPAPGMATLRAAAVADNLQSICVLSSGSAGTHALRIDVESGAVTETLAVPPQVGAALSLPGGISAGDYFVYPAGDRLYAYPICGEVELSGGSGRRTLVSQPIAGLNSTGILLRAVQDTPGWFTVDGIGGTAVYTFTDTAVVSVFSENVTALVGPVHGSLHGETGKRLAIAAPRKDGYEVRVRHTRLGAEQAVPATAGAYNMAQHGAVDRLLAQQLRDGSFRAVVSTVKGSLLAIEHSKVLWARTGLDVGKVEL